MGRRYKTEEVTEILDYYTQRHTQAETMARFGITKNQLQYLVKRMGVKNGRTARQIATANARTGADKAAQKNIEHAGERLREKLTRQGFTLVSEYKSKNNAVVVKCLRCGDVIKRTPHHIKQKGLACRNCLKQEKTRRRDEERQVKQNAQEARRAQQEAEHLARLNAPHVCKTCGKPYTIANYMASTGTRYERDSGYCSRECRDRTKRERDNKTKHREKHYHKAKRLGLPAERGITLEKLIARDGPVCALCGLPVAYYGDSRSDLYPSIDHIIPTKKGGGHVWTNVQVAHRICNSYKRDLISEKWHNNKTPQG